MKMKYTELVANKLIHNEYARTRRSNPNTLAGYELHL